MQIFYSYPKYLRLPRGGARYPYQRDAGSNPGRHTALCEITVSLRSVSPDGKIARPCGGWSAVVPCLLQLKDQLGENDGNA
jgi:hypothetical protein